MRFLVIVKEDQRDIAVDTAQMTQMFEEMGKFNEELVKAGVMLDGMGLMASAKGAKVKFSKGKPTVVDGPFAETKELIAGFWLIQVKNKAEAIEWAKRVPFGPVHMAGDGEIELRQVFETEDFGESEAVDRHKALGEKLAKQKK